MEICLEINSETFFDFVFLDAISDVPQFVLTKMGNLQLLDSKGYIYNKCQTPPGITTKVHWECNGRRKFGCRIRVKTIEGKIVSELNLEHNHLPMDKNRSQF